jgi:hypothetical protein
LRSLLASEYQKLRDRGAKPKEALPLLKEYAVAGLYQPLFGLVAALDVSSKIDVLESSPELLFPLKFSESAVSQGERFQVPAELIFSIIRQESSFNPNARSPVDALGLMQMMPQVVDSLKPLTGISIQHFEDLYDPSINITLGTALLKKLRDKYKGQFILTVAGYNANDRAISQWLKTRWKGDPLMFIEDIPYEETKSHRSKAKPATLGCLAPSVEVLTNRGWVPIVDVADDDLLWDGEEWVAHGGVQYMGDKETMDFNGVECTPDHKFFDGENWHEAESADVGSVFGWASRHLPD